jgi:hypothetical protein
LLISSLSISNVIMICAPLSRTLRGDDVIEQRRQLDEEKMPKSGQESIQIRILERWLGGSTAKRRADLLSSRLAVILNNFELRPFLVGNAHRHIVEDEEAFISIATEGQISIIVPSSVTARIVGGLYEDAMRATIAGGTCTPSMGPVGVIDDLGAKAGLRKNPALSAHSPAV